MKYPSWTLITVFFLNGTAFAQKTDVLVFNNGDRLTGEVRRLDRGILSFNTDATGTISVEWDEVAYLSSDQRIEVELENGIRYLGRLTHAEEAEQIQVQDLGSEQVIVPRTRVVHMLPIEEELIEQFDIDVAAGYDFTKSSDVATTHLNVDVSFRREKNGGSFSFDTYLTDKAITTTDMNGMETTVNESTQRQVLNASYDRFFNDRWVAQILMGLERNDELGIELRSTVGVAGGRDVRQTNSHRIRLLGGLTYNQEEITDSDESEETMEGLMAATVEWFRYDTPELDISTTISLFPNLTDTGRYRSNVDVDFQWEIIEDFFVGFSLYHTYDSDPPNPEAAQTDYGIITSLGWSF